MLIGYRVSMSVNARKLQTPSQLPDGVQRKQMAQDHSGWPTRVTGPPLLVSLVSK